MGCVKFEDPARPPSTDLGEVIGYRVLQFPGEMKLEI